MGFGKKTMVGFFQVNRFAYHFIPDTVETHPSYPSSTPGFLFNHEQNLWFCSWSSATAYPITFMCKFFSWRQLTGPESSYKAVDVSVKSREISHPLFYFKNSFVACFISKTRTEGLTTIEQRGKCFTLPKTQNRSMALIQSDIVKERLALLLDCQMCYSAFGKD